MAVITREQMSHLRPYLEGDQPNSVGEWGMHCPLHNDLTRSASLNVETGLWYCNVCEIGGAVDELVQRILGGGRNIGGFTEDDGTPKSNGHKKKVEPPSEALIRGWAAGLVGNEDRLKALQDRRGLTPETIERFQIGWDTDQKAYTIPIRNMDGTVANVRFYQLDPGDDRRKIWSVTGLGSPDIYPITELDDASEIIVCEGEWDALLTIQNGFPAVTRTGAAKVWRAQWNTLFDDKIVYICHDMDDAGQQANRRVSANLKNHARAVFTVDLPYPVVEKHGKDLTDFWQDGHTEVEFKEMMATAPGQLRDPSLVEGEVVDVNVLDSFDASVSGNKLRMRVTITGKTSPSYLIPKEVDYTCTQDAGVKCQICPMNEYQGQASRHISSQDSIVLRMIGATHQQLHDLMREVVHAQKCNRLTIDTREHRTVEKLHVRPSVEISARWTELGDHTSRQIISVGRHDSLPNNTVEVVGTIFPDPRTQHNDFQAWEVSRTETAVDRFEVTPSTVKALSVFRTRPGERPLAKLADISADLAAHVTRIYGRAAMHAMFDLVWHAALHFRFGEEIIKRGWIEALCIGDTRTGKSEAADKLRSFYNAGELISCEAASFSGIVGGLQQFGNKEWEVTWGVVPLNDRRLVVLDEVSGLTPEQIAQLSSIRSSGEAQLTKIRSERTWARTRLLWLANPRTGRLADYTYGVQAIRPLIGNNEDIARFDLAMSVTAADVDKADINRDHAGSEAKQKYAQELCQQLVQWAWSRTADQILWDEGARDAVYRAAIDLGNRYVEDPPLIQSANARIKVARIAVALAMRTFSTDKGGDCVVVKPIHVSDTVKFIDRLYSMGGFGYKEISQERIADAKEALGLRDEAAKYLVSQGELSKFLRSLPGGKFRRQDLEDMMMMDRDGAQTVIMNLWKYRLVRREAADIKMQPILHELLREIK